ncbi:MAG: glycosyltransferase, partial [Candidatus Yanofskybacteria bacterium]|nr:glycosyltransferase [Candidatus Yanofskybacteria bacterium]
ISEDSKKKLMTIFKIPSDRIEVNHLGVDAHPEVSTSKGDYILFSAQAFPRRHLKETLLAFEKIAPHFPDLKFKVVAIDKYTPLVIGPLIREINTRLGSERIQYQERVSGEVLVDLMAHAKALTYISTEEAFGLPPVEALAFGTMPVVADNGLTREDNAFFVKNPDSVDEIAQALRAALTDTHNQSQITAAAPEMVNRLSWKAHADRFLNLVRNV